MDCGKTLICALILCTATSVLADDPVEEQTAPEEANGLIDAIVNSRLKAMLRYSGQYRNSNLHLLQDSSTPDISDEKKQQYSALGGFAGFETLPWFHTSVGATFYTAVPFGHNPDSRRGLGGLYEEDGGQDAYAVLGEVFIKYQNGGHLLKMGRQEMPAYRFVSLSNIRMTPITHTGVVYENSVFDKLKINLGVISKMKERNAEKFIDMARGARLIESANGKQIIRGDYDRSDYDDSAYIGANKEMGMAGLVHTGEQLTLEAWDYYVNDFLNTLYLYAHYGFKPAGSRFIYTVAAQYTSQKDVGNHIAGNIDTTHWGLRLQAAGKSLTWFAGYNKVAYNEKSYDGGTIFVRWGTPQMFNSFQVQDSELAGTESWGLGLQYDFGHRGLIPGIVMRWRYADYDLPDRLNQTDARQDRAEATFDLRYSFTKLSGFGIFSEMKGLSLQFRLAYNNYRTDYDFEAYRDLHGYDFATATKDFYDARLYLDYLF